MTPSRFRDTWAAQWNVEVSRIAPDDNLVQPKTGADDGPFSTR